MHVIHPSVNDSSMHISSFLINVIMQSSGEILDFSHVMHARLQSFSLLNPFLTIDCKLTLRLVDFKSSMESTNDV